MQQQLRPSSTSLDGNHPNWESKLEDELADAASVTCSRARIGIEYYEATSIAISDYDNSSTVQNVIDNTLPALITDSQEYIPQLHFTEKDDLIEYLVFDPIGYVIRSDATEYYLMGFHLDNTHTRIIPVDDFGDALLLEQHTNTTNDIKYTLHTKQISQLKNTKHAYTFHITDDKQYQVAQKLFNITDGEVFLTQ